MKKYLNKGLLYAWFNAAKAPISIGILIWGFTANKIIEDNLNGLKYKISDEFTNYFNTSHLEDYLILGIIFISIYFIAQGINKRNTEMFLSSGPYIKKQIKYNEFISFLITLILFVITYIYIALMAFVRNREFLSIVEGYESIIFIEISRITLLGIIGILFMLIINSMFSNSVIGFISMISVIPASIIIVFVKVGSILKYLGILNVWDKIVFTHENLKYYQGIVLLDSLSIREVRYKYLFIEIIITLFIIICMIFIFNITQRKYKLEHGNKIFSSRINENILVILVSVAFSSFISSFFISNFISNMQRKTGEYLPLTGVDLIKGFGADIFCVVVVGFITYKVMKRILKNIV